MAHCWQQAEAKHQHHCSLLATSTVIMWICLQSQGSCLCCMHIDSQYTLATTLDAWEIQQHALCRNTV